MLLLYALLGLAAAWAVTAYGAGAEAVPIHPNALGYRRFAEAIGLKCEALVTGGRTHFGAGYGRSFGGVTVHSPRSLAEALLR
jgi:hypothetical protein